MKQYIFNVKLTEVKTKSNSNVFAIVATDVPSALEKALKFGTEPEIIAGPYELSSAWDIA